MLAGQLLTVFTTVVGTSTVDVAVAVARVKTVEVAVPETGVEKLYCFSSKVLETGQKVPT